MSSKRSIARELALLTFSQTGKNIEKWENKDITEIISISVETLAKEAEDNIQASVRELAAMRDYIQNYEIDHPSNLERPVDALIKPVPIPLTSDMSGRVEQLLEAAEKLYSALDIVQVSAMSEREEVKNYTIKLVKTFIENQKTVDDAIKEHAKGWDVNRLLKVDRDILRISITELLYFEDIPSSVSIDEAVELAKKYGTEESSSFINGILRQVYEDIIKPKSAPSNEEG